MYVEIKFDNYKSFHILILLATSPVLMSTPADQRYAGTH